MTREAQCLLYVIGVMEGMRREGWIEGPSRPLTPKGLHAYAEMQERGFAISREDVRQCLRVMNSKEPDDDLLALTAHCAGAPDWNGDDFGSAA